MAQHVDDINDLYERGFVSLPKTLLTCKTSQCRVETFRPHSSKAQDQKCPACYGAGS